MKKPCKGCEMAETYNHPSGKVRCVCKNMSYRYCDKYILYEEFLESKRRYTKGERVKSIQEYMKLKENGQTLFYWHDRIRHIGWLESLQFRVLDNSIQQGYIYYAIKKVE